MQKMRGSDASIGTSPEFDPEEVIRELSEEEILFMQMIGGAKGLPPIGG
ncbi:MULTISPECIES: hypothetical protein [Pseudomonas]|nr:hypothetical protein [Pseudomonas sp. 25 E 4]CRM12392.1 hypothetical protein [Pseudomonas sp. 25 E 4]